MDRYQAALGSFISQALVAILVVFSPNLTSMATPQPFFHHDEKETYPLVDFLRRTNASSDTTPYFQNLRKIYLINKSDSCWSDGRFYVKMDLLGCWELFDQLPSIEYIGIDLLDWDDNGKQALDPRRSNFSKIAIHHSRVGSNGLIQMITSCKVLKEFQYSIGGRASNDGGNPLVNAKAIIKAILGHKETLETLDIDVDDRLHHMEGVTGDEEEYEDMEDDLDQYGGPLEHYLEDSVLGTLRSIWVRTGSLKDLGSLKKLSLGFIFLLYCATGVSATRPAPKRCKIPLVADCLPESLEYLCIKGYEKGENEEFDRQADALMALYESGSSNLKSLKGITEKIPNAENVDDPDGEYHLLWSLTERGYESD
jgi:hypothetical protein